VLLIALAASSTAARMSAPLVVTIYNPTPNTVRLSGAGAAAQESVGFAVVTERRTLSLTAGTNVVRVEGIPRLIDPASVHVVDETDPSARLVQQVFADDVSVDGLLGRYVGQPIVAVLEHGELKGTLVRFDADWLVLRGDDGQVQALSRKRTVRDVRFGDLPRDVTSRAALIWTIEAKKGGEHTIELTYETRGLAWSASYSAILSDNDRKLELGGWLAVHNVSGARFPDAVLRVVAGDVARPSPSPYVEIDDASGAAPVPSMRPPSFRQTLERTASLEPGDVTQVPLQPPTTAAGRRVLVYEHVPQQAAYLAQPQAYPLFDQAADGAGTATQASLTVVLAVANSKANGLGAPLPPGPLRVFRRDAEGGLELVAEDGIPATPKDGAVQVKIGTSGDVTAQRRQADFQVDEGAHQMRERFEIALHNTRKEAVEVEIVEHIYRWSAWTIEATTTPGIIGPDGQTARFAAKLPPGGTQTLAYTVLYTW
jgi:hypothetical protein